MAASITETRPDLYRALMADGWQWRDHKGGGGAFTREVGGSRVAVQVKRGLACELWVDARHQVARFLPVAPDSVVASAAVAQAQELAR